MRISMALLVVSCLAASAQDSAQDAGIRVDPAALQLSTITPASVNFSTLAFPGLLPLQLESRGLLVSTGAALGISTGPFLSGQFIALPAQQFQLGESRADFERRLAEERKAFQDALTIRLREFDAEQARLRQEFQRRGAERSFTP